MTQPFVLSTLAVLLLLGVGVAARATIAPLRWALVPASVAGGVLGLILVRLGLHFDTTAAATGEFAGVLAPWPGVLVAVVFAGMLLEKPGRGVGAAFRRAGRQGLVVWILVLGQAAVGILVTWLLVMPFYDVPATFGQLVEAGFAGGHGTAVAMGNVYADVNDFPQGQSLALLFATVGILWGVASGIFLVNLGVRRGWANPGHAAPAGRTDAFLRASPSAPSPAAFATVRKDVVDPLAFQLVLLAAAFAIGWLFRQSFLFLADLAFGTGGGTDDPVRYVANVPLFLFTLLGGWILRQTLVLARLDDLLDAASLHRLTGIAMEILIVAALVTVRVDAAAQFLLPVALLLVTGAAWCVFGLLFLAPRLLPKDYWFELGVLNYGMSTATTAQGLLLLRVIDPDARSRAGEDYAAAAPLSAPFVGGGVVTLLVTPLALATVGPGPVVLVLSLLLLGLYALARRLARGDCAR